MHLGRIEVDIEPFQLANLRSPLENDLSAPRGRTPATVVMLGIALLAFLDSIPRANGSRRASPSSRIQIDGGSSMLRCNLLKSALASTAGALALASAGAADAGNELESMAVELTKGLYADDGLALPIPTIPTISNLAKGRDATPWTALSAPTPLMSM
jgi:hypothetical protein